MAMLPRQNLKWTRTEILKCLEMRLNVCEERCSRTKWFSKKGLIKKTYLVLIDVNVVVGTVVEVEIVDSVVYVEKVGLDVDNELKNKNTKHGNA